MEAEPKTRSMTLTDRLVALLIAVVAVLMAVGAGSVIPHLR
jgi:hypothetical protein